MTGRPSLYRPEFCKSLKEHCALGYSIRSFAAEIGVSPNTMKKWRKRHPEFAYACEVALCARCHYWETAMLEILRHGRNRQVTNAEVRTVVFMVRMLWRQTGETPA